MHDSTTQPPGVGLTLAILVTTSPAIADAIDRSASTVARGRADPEGPGGAGGVGWVSKPPVALAETAAFAAGVLTGCMGATQRVPTFWIAIRRATRARGGAS